MVESAAQGRRELPGISTYQILDRRLDLHPGELSFGTVGSNRDPWTIGDAMGARSSRQLQWWTAGDAICSVVRRLTCSNDPDCPRLGH